ncbi:MAG TPA: aminotransferase class III-fold pyridoxal phosphate-dependent enzyme, partial [Thermoanaerobaculia bacterium]|nr:aminotransferase class III-fold pyridoxal phosphate-dependent enzyme [Thermoanaerobaculia bacterium]
MAARKLRRKAAAPPPPKKKTPKKPAAPRRRRVRRTTESDRLYARAKAKMPGGVSSPVRSFKSVGATPFFVKKAKGSVIVDADGNLYVDYVMSYGPHLFGHMPKAVLSAIRKALPRGTSYGAPCRAEVELAERVSRLVPSMEKVRFVSS